MSLELELLTPICCAPTSAPPLARDEAVRVASGFKALADPARVQLLHLVSSSEAAESCVCDLTAALGLSQGRSATTSRSSSRPDCSSASVAARGRGTGSCRTPSPPSPEP